MQVFRSNLTFMPWRWRDAPKDVTGRGGADRGPAAEGGLCRGTVRRGMPFIQVTHTPGALDGVDREELTEDLTAAASDAEGTDLERARPVTWVTFDAPDDFRCAADPAVAVRATVAEGLLDDADRGALVSGVTDALSAAVDGLDPTATWVVVEEVPDGRWGAGGDVVPTEEIAALTGADAGG